MTYLIFQSRKLFNCSIKIRKIQSLGIHRISESFPPIKEVSFRPESKKSTTSTSQKLMLDYGIILPQHNGIYSLLPLGLRAVEKLIKIIELHLAKVKCKKLSLPHLSSSSLWKMSGRLDSCGSEVFRLSDRNQEEFILSPTHEEVITYLISSLDTFTHANLPVRLFQITSKFRDEQRAKHGLMRGREFLMKDLYTFDKDSDDAKITYEQIVNTYIDIFNTLELPVEKVQASVGSIGGTESHEFHIISNIGEDTFLSCKKCNFKANVEVVDQDTATCPKCEGNLVSVKGIEVGQSFLLGTKYSSPMSAHYQTADGKQKLLYMGCYGIGVTRLLAAGIEALSKDDNHIVWPTGMAPFKVCLIPPKKGSKESINAHWCDYLANVINNIPEYKDDVIIDDRLKFTIGQRFNYAKRFGYPLIIIIGKQASDQIPLFEVIHKNETFLLNQADLLEYLRNIS